MALRGGVASSNMTEAVQLHSFASDTKMNNLNGYHEFKIMR